MDRERFRVDADIFLDICISCVFCGNRFWYGYGSIAWGDIQSAISDHERECLALPEEETYAAKDNHPQTPSIVSQSKTHSKGRGDQND